MNALLFLKISDIISLSFYTILWQVKQEFFLACPDLLVTMTTFYTVSAKTMFYLIKDNKILFNVNFEKRGAKSETFSMKNTDFPYLGCSSFRYASAVKKVKKCVIIQTLQKSVAHGSLTSQKSIADHVFSKPHKRQESKIHKIFQTYQMIFFLFIYRTYRA